MLLSFFGWFHRLRALNSSLHRSFTLMKHFLCLLLTATIRLSSMTSLFLFILSSMFIIYSMIFLKSELLLLPFSLAISNSRLFFMRFTPRWVFLIIISKFFFIVLFLLTWHLMMMPIWWSWLMLKVFLSRGSHLTWRRSRWWSIDLTIWERMWFLWLIMYLSCILFFFEIINLLIPI